MSFNIAFQSFSLLICLIIFHEEHFESIRKFSFVVLLTLTIILRWRWCKLFSSCWFFWFYNIEKNAKLLEKVSRASSFWWSFASSIFFFIWHELNYANTRKDDSTPGLIRKLPTTPESAHYSSHCMQFRIVNFNKSVKEKPQENEKKIMKRFHSNIFFF